MNWKCLRKSNNIHWWDEWAVGDGKTIGMRYGATVKKYNLMSGLLEGINNQPYGRRHVISLWQENDFCESEGLNPCAFMTMWSVRKKTQADGQVKRFRYDPCPAVE